MDGELLIEKDYLTNVKKVASEQLELLVEQSTEKKRNIMDEKSGLGGEANQSIANLWSSSEFEALVELSQYASQVSEKIANYEFDIRRIGALEKLLQAPYFGRIDFIFEDEDESEKFYIGRTSLYDSKDGMLVYDWRSPVSSMFYRFGIGAAFYDAPVGRVSGEITLKRQYEMKNGDLQFYFDSNLHILDEILREALSKNSSPQMKAIVETIQKEQDIIIRDVDNDVLLVQGAAGSGKTSVALHRVAYLMYQDFSSKITSANIVIISPHNLFENYIKTVIPELTEESITSYLFDEIFEMILKRKRLVTKNRFFEQLLSCEDKNLKKLMKDSLMFKSSSAFIAILDRIKKFGKQPKDIFATYKNIFDEGYFQLLSKDIALPGNINEILEFTRVNLETQTVHYDDLAAITYLHLIAFGFDKLKFIKQVVVDEAQDYYPIHYKILGIIFPNARFTILGDIYQTIEKHEDSGFYDEIKDILHKKKTAILTLLKSFRCSNEIMNFSSQLIGREIESFDRKSFPPQIVGLSCENDFDALVKEVDECRSLGYETIAIICKSEKDCSYVFEKIRGSIDVTLISKNSDTEMKGTLILPVYLSKGLEFDSALVWSADRIRYNEPDDRNLLYIACTRALHRLSIFYYGEICHFLA